MIKSKYFMIVIFLFLFLSSNVVFSQDIKNTDSSAVAVQVKDEKPRSLYGIEFLTGFGLAKLGAPQGDYHVIPFLVDLDFDLASILKKNNIPTLGLVQFVLEPFISSIYDPRSNVEIGNNFLIKIGFLPNTWRFQPYFKGGAGLIYLTQHTREQGSQFNFNEHIGCGLHYFFKKNLALTLEYRYRHISNAGIEHPNDGINTNFAIGGVSYVF